MVSSGDITHEGDKDTLTPTVKNDEQRKNATTSLLILFFLFMIHTPFCVYYITQNIEKSSKIPKSLIK